MQFNKQIFGNLPQELYREIYEYDNTYHAVFSSSEFVNELAHYLYKNQYTLIYSFIDELNKFRLTSIKYYIILQWHLTNPNIMCFNLIPVNPDLTPMNTYIECDWYGFICEEDYSIGEPAIVESDLDYMTTKQIPSSSLILYGDIITEYDQYL